MALDRDAMITFLEKKGCKVVGETERFNGSQGGIWLSGEEDDGLFDYYSQSSKFELGILKTLREAVEEQGWWFEWNDPGTIMCWPD